MDLIFLNSYFAMEKFPDILTNPVKKNIRKKAGVGVSWCVVCLFACSMDFGGKSTSLLVYKFFPDGSNL